MEPKQALRISRSRWHLGRAGSSDECGRNVRDGGGAVSGYLPGLLSWPEPSGRGSGGARERSGAREGGTRSGHEEGLLPGTSYRQCDPMVLIHRISDIGDYFIFRFSADRLRPDGIHGGWPR